jgi:hypothetical protein
MASCISFNSIYYVSIAKGFLSFHYIKSFLTSTYGMKVKRCLSLQLFSAAFCYFETMMFFPELVKIQLTAEDQKGATFFCCLLKSS